MSLLAHPRAVYSTGVPNYPVPMAVKSMFRMIVHLRRIISLLTYPAAFYTKSISLLVYPVVVHTSSDIGLVYPAIVYTRFSLLLAYPTMPNFYSILNFSLPNAVSSMYSKVVHSISVPFTAYSTGPYPRHCEVTSF